MICGVVAQLKAGQGSQRVIQKLSSRKDIDVGDAQGARRLPLVISSPDSEEMEKTHRWLESLDEIEFLDVVYVHLDDQNNPSNQRTSDQSPNSTE